MLAWVNLLQTDGLVNRVLEVVHLGSGDRNWLDGDWPTVVMGLIYGYIPFFILPLYAALERLDVRLLEASRDLGGSSFWTFIRVTLPLSVPGLLAASVIVVLPMCGDYYTNTYLTGGSPRTEMVGNQIEFYLRGSSQPQTGASLVIVLMVFLMVAMAYYLVTIARSQRDGSAVVRRRRFGPLMIITWLYVIWSLAPVLIAVRISFNFGEEPVEHPVAVVSLVLG